MKYWIKRIKAFLGRVAQADLIRDYQVMDAIILSSWLTGQRKAEMHEVKMIIQVFPQKGKNYIAQHSGFFHEKEMKLLLKTGHKVRVHSGDPGKAKLLLNNS